MRYISLDEHVGLDLYQCPHPFHVPFVGSIVDGSPAILRGDREREGSLLTHLPCPSPAPLTPNILTSNSHHAARVCVC